MPYLEWSDTNLPLPSRLTVKNVSVASRKKMESGRTLQRLRYMSQLEEGTVQWTLLNEKFQIFKGVHSLYLRNGMDWFFIDLPVGGSDKLTRCQVRFIDDYSWAYSSVDHVRVTAKIEFLKVESPDSLALANLISSGSSSLFEAAQPIKMTWTNVDGTASTLKRIRYFWFQVGGGYITMANQFWDGELYIGNTMQYQYFPATGSEQYFVTEAWSPLTTSDPTPKDPQPKVGGFDFFSSPYLKYFDINQRGGFDYMEFSGQPYWECDPLLQIKITSTFRWFRLYSNPYILNLEYVINHPTHDIYTTNQLMQLGNCANIQSIKAVEGDFVGRCNTGGFQANDNDSLTELDISLFDIGDAQSLDIYQFRIYNNDSLQKITLGSLKGERARCALSGNPILDEVVIDGDYIMFELSQSWRDNNLDIISLKNVVDKMIGSPRSTALGNKIQLRGNPSWVGDSATGELFPYRWRKVGIDNITSTATNFTVETSESHLLIAGDETVLENVVRQIEIDSISSNSVQFQVNTATDHLLSQGEEVEIINVERRFNLTGITSTATEFTITTDIDHKLVGGESLILEGVTREVAINTITSTATEFTVTTLVDHGLSVGQSIDIEGMTNANYNSTWIVDTIPTPDTFTVLDSNNYGSGGSQGTLNTLFVQYNTAWFVNTTPTSNTFTINAQDDYGIGFGGVARQQDNAYNNTWTVQTILTSDTFLIGSNINLGAAINGKVLQADNVFNDLWVVDSVISSSIFTVLSNNNADGAIGGIMKEEDNADTKYVEETALANNFRFVW